LLALLPFCTNCSVAALEAQKLRTALQLAMSVSRAGNGFFQETEIWAKYKTDRPAAAACISACCGIVALLAALLQPFMPSFARKLLDQLALAEAPALSDDIIEKSKAIADILPAGHRIAAQEPTPLFRKITDAEVAEFRARFAGSQNERATIESTSGDKATGKEKKANGAPQAASAGEGEGGKAKKGPKGSVTTAADGKVDGVKAGTPGGQVQGKGDRPVDVSRIDLRVGLIRKAWRHPDAER
jgi:methionyl-tRNA synthetase